MRSPGARVKRGPRAKAIAGMKRSKRKNLDITDLKTDQDELLKRLKLRLENVSDPLEILREIHVETFENLVDKLNLFMEAEVDKVRDELQERLDIVAGRFSDLSEDVEIRGDQLDMKREEDGY
jgi:hypothetical protein